VLRENISIFLSFYLVLCEDIKKLLSLIFGAIWGYLYFTIIDICCSLWIIYFTVTATSWHRSRNTFFFILQSVVLVQGEPNYILLPVISGPIREEQYFTAFDIRSVMNLIIFYSPLFLVQSEHSYILQSLLSGAGNSPIILYCTWLSFTSGDIKSEYYFTVSNIWSGRIFTVIFVTSSVINRFIAVPTWLLLQI